MHTIALLRMLKHDTVHSEWALDPLLVHAVHVHGRPLQLTEIDLVQNSEGDETVRNFVDLFWTLGLQSSLRLPAQNLKRSVRTSQ